MKASENTFLSAGINGLSALYRGRAATPLEVLDAHVARRERINPALNAIVHNNDEAAYRDAAASAERWRTDEPLSVLDGIPIAIKANVAVAGLPWTGAVKAYAKRLAATDSLVVQRLRAAGAVIVGVANMHEAAFGATTDSPLYGPCRHPERLGYTPGGSSGGSAVAVAAGLAAGAIGTDTMGSVRLPSAYCGIAGFKPTFGVLPRSGVIALSWSLDHVGVHARRAADLGPMIAACAGLDASDPGSVVTLRRTFVQKARVPLRGLRLAAVRPEALGALSPGVARGYETALGALRDAGVRITMTDLGGYDFARMRREALLIVEAEGAVALADALEAEDGVSQGLRRLLEFGAQKSALRLAAAQEAILTARPALRHAVEGVAALLLPTTPQVAFPHVQAPPATQADLTAFANCAGAPAATIPIGPADEGLPAGLQIIGAPGADARVLAIAEALEPLIRFT